MTFRIFCYMRIHIYYDTGGSIIPLEASFGTVATVITL